MSRFFSTAVIVVHFGFTALSVRTARAEPDSPNDAASARHFFQRGRDAAARDDAADACANFEESQRLDPAAGTLFNLAACEEQLGRLASALQHLQDGLDKLEGDDPRRAHVQRSLVDLERRVPLLAVRLPPRVQAQVFRDGVELANRSLGMPLPVNPGLHRVTVRAAGRADAIFSIKMAPGDNETLEVAPAMPDMNAPLQGFQGQSSRPTSSLRAVGWVTGALGVGGLGAGAITAALAFERSQVVHQHCEGTVCDERGLDALESSKRFASAASLSLGLAAVFLTAGITMWVLGKPTDKATRSSLVTWTQF